MALFIVSIMLVSAVPALPLAGLEEPLPAGIAQTEDTGAILALVTDDVGRPMADAKVSVVGLDITEITDSAGFALIDSLPTDVNWTQYSVFANKSGYGLSPPIEVTVSPFNTTNVTLRISGGFLYVVVEDAVGPISGASVLILGLGYSNTTGSDGSCFIWEVPGGVELAVAVTALGYEASPAKTITLDIGGHEVLIFLLVPLTGAIAGAVRHATTIEPLFNATVSVVVGAVTMSAFSDADGSYRIPGLPSGTYTVSASMYGFEPSSVPGVVVENGSDTEGVDLFLVEKPTKLYGIVRSGSFLIPGALVAVVGTDLSASTSVNGTYEITNITAGTYSLTASLEGYITITVAGVVIPRGGEVQMNINMESIPGPSISGLVLSTDDNMALSGVTVTASGLGTQRTTITNVEGQFIITGLTAGNYTIRFFLVGYQPIELWSVTVLAEGVTLLDEVLMEPASDGFGGFIFGFDLAHSMMILALFLTIIILALAVMLRVRGFEAPDKAPAVYDQEDEGEPSSERQQERTKEKDNQRKKDKKRK
jgi:hypothetical protein